MNLREKKVLTTAERNQLVNEYGPLQIVIVEATEDMPKITKLIDKNGFCTSHFMVQDLFGWQHSNQIEELPEDKYVPVGKYYVLSYQTEYAEAPESVRFQLTRGQYSLTEEDLPELEQVGMIFEGWTLNGVPAVIGMKISENSTLVASWRERTELTITYYNPYGTAPQSKTVATTQGTYTLTKQDLPELDIEGYYSDWSLNNQVVTVSTVLTEDSTLVAVKSNRRIINVGDYLYSDGSSSTEYDSSKTPIAVCVAPGSHFPDGEARWVSIVNMSATNPEQGTTVIGNDIDTNPGAGIVWGANGLIGTVSSSPKALATDESVITEDNPGGLLNELSEEIDGYALPVDYLTEFPIDYPFYSEKQIYAYNEEGPNYNLPYLFLNDGSRNPLCNQAGTYLVDFDGKEKTLAIMELASKYLTGEVDKSDDTEGSYPAPTVCHRFFTEGTQPGDWYLPAQGEIGYLAANLSVINTKLTELGDLAVGIGMGVSEEYPTDTLGGCLWSSSEFSESNARDLGTSRGILDTAYSRDTQCHTFRVRAFLRFTPNN